MFQENKEFYDYDKDHKKKLILLEKQVEDLLLRFENIKDNTDISELNQKLDTNISLNI